MKIALRLTLTAALMVGVYSETGPWTTLAFVLTFLGFEAVTKLLEDRRAPDEFSRTIAALFAPPPEDDR